MYDYKFFSGDMPEVIENVVRLSNKGWRLHTILLHPYEDSDIPDWFYVILERDAELTTTQIAEVSSGPNS